MTWDYFKGSLVNQAFFTTHLFLFTSNFPGFLFWEIRTGKSKQEQSCRVRRDKLSLLAKRKLFWKCGVNPLWKDLFYFISFSLNAPSTLYRPSKLSFGSNWVQKTETFIKRFQGHFSEIQILILIILLILILLILKLKKVLH